MNQDDKTKVKKVLDRMAEIPDRFPKRTPEEERTAFRELVLTSWTRWQQLRQRWLREDRRDLVTAVETSRQCRRFARIRDRWRDRSRQFRQRYHTQQTGLFDRQAEIEKLRRRQYALQEAWIRARVSAITLDARAGAAAQAPGGRRAAARLGGEAMQAEERCQALEAALWRLEVDYWFPPLSAWSPAASWRRIYGSRPSYQFGPCIPLGLAEPELVGLEVERVRVGSVAVERGLMAELEATAQRRAPEFHRQDRQYHWSGMISGPPG